MSRKTSLKEKITAQIKRVGAILLGTLLMTMVMTGICYLLVQIIPQDSLYEISHGHRSGENLFRVFLIDPIPKNVTILHSQDDGGFGDYILLHFKISPDDFNSILASEKYEISSFTPISGYYTDTENPEITWWNLRSLGKNATNYFVSIEYDGHQRYQNIWVNEQRNEIYFEVTFIY